MKRVRWRGTATAERRKEPVSPSVRGTGKQSERERKGDKRPSFPREESAIRTETIEAES